MLIQSVEEGRPFNAAILDFMMAEMDGLELGRRIKADERIKDVPLILMTSMGQRGEGKKLEAIGFSAYLSKPVRQGHLHDSLALVLGRQTAREGTQVPKRLITQFTLTEVARQRIRLLLAEDNPVNQMVAVTLLKKQGYHVDVVSNGLEALAALERIPYDLVLMDCQMPEMDGFEATRAIRGPDSHVLNPEVPVIALTAHAMTGDRERCEDAGMNDYLAKPIRPAELGAVLERWLKKNKQPGDNKQREPENESPQAVPQATGTTAAQNGLDPAVFNGEELLKRMMNDRNLVGVILTAFLEDMPIHIEKMRLSLQNKDTQTVYLMAHSIKGSSSYLSASLLRQEAEEAEKLAAAGNLDGVAALLPRIEIEFARFKEAVSPKKDGPPLP